MKSVLQKNRECWECGRVDVLNDHHIIYGTANRRISEEYGFKVWLCPEHHTGKHGVHNNNKLLDLRLKTMAQTYFESNLGSRKDFIRLFGRNFL